jgi:hypothetical protein
VYAHLAIETAGVAVGTIVEPLDGSDDANDGVKVETGGIERLGVELSQPLITTSVIAQASNKREFAAPIGHLYAHIGRPVPPVRRLR